MTRYITTYATRLDASFLFVEDGLPWVKYENGQFYIDPDLSGGAAYLSGGTLYVDDSVTIRTALPEPSLDTLLAGFRGTVDVRHRLYRSSINGEKGEEVREVSTSGATVTLSNFRDNTWELSLSFENPETAPVLGEWVRVYTEVRETFTDPGVTEWREFPMGLYKLDPSSMSHNYLYSVYQITGRSPEVVLSENAAYTGYTAAAGAGVLATVRTILTDLGIPASRIKLPTTEVTLPRAMFFSPLQDFSSTYYLRIVNSLLNAGGFRAIFADAEGRLTTEALGQNDSGVADITYSSATNQMVTGEIAEERDYETLANRVVVYAYDSNADVAAPPVVGVAENRDPDSPVSIGNLGRVVQREPVLLETVVSQDVADALALEQLRRNSGFGQKLNLSTFPDPRRGAREVYELDITQEDGTVVAAGLWDVIGWSYPLGVGEPMTHELTRRINI